MTDPDLSRTLRTLAEEAHHKLSARACRSLDCVFCAADREVLMEFAQAVAAAARQEQRERDAEIAEESAKWREPIGLRSNGKPYAKSVLVKLTQCRDCRADEGENIARAIRAQATLRSQEIP